MPVKHKSLCKIGIRHYPDRNYIIDTDRKKIDLASFAGDRKGILSGGVSFEKEISSIFQCERRDRKSS